MLVIPANIFSAYHEIGCGVSTKIGLNRGAPYFFNLSYSVDDDPENVKLNRQAFFSFFGVKVENAAFQKQIHTDNISIAVKGGSCGESDALITDKKDLALLISTADCAPVFLYAADKKVIAGVHSGWRSTELNITSKVISRMQTEFGCSPGEMFAYVGPSICGSCYEVGKEFKEKFDSKYLRSYGEKYKLDLPLRIYDQLISSGVKHSNIEISGECTFGNKDLLHSYRRDGLRSGRALGVIVIKN